MVKKLYRNIYLPNHPYCKSNGLVFEHRLVMEKKIGRYLRPEEVIHHIDGNTLNNDIDNLELFENHKKHQLSRHTFPECCHAKKNNNKRFSNLLLTKTIKIFDDSNFESGVRLIEYLNFSGIESCWFPYESEVKIKRRCDWERSI